MRAIVLREPGPAATSLRLETLPDPTPGPGQVVVRVAHAGVCFHDVVVRNGTLKAGVSLPVVLGHEIAGHVAALGAGVRGFRVGDAVATTQRSHVCGACRHCRMGREPLCAEAAFLGDAGLNGGYAEFCVLDMDSLVPVPEGVDLRAASIAACAIGTAYHAVVAIGAAQPGELVLVTGASGGVGMHAVQIARDAGCEVFATTTSPDQVDTLRALGADHVICHQRGEDFAPMLRELTNGEGVEVALDNVGAAVFQPVRRSMARGGRFVMVGQLDGAFVPFNPAQLFLKGVSLLASTSVTREELRRCLALLARGSVRAIMGGAMKLADAALAHEMMEAGRAKGRITLDIAA